MALRRPGAHHRLALEDDRAVAVLEDAVVQVGHYGSGQDEALYVAA